MRLLHPISKIIIMRLLHPIKFTALYATLLIMWLSACNKQDDLETFVPDRVFTPTNVDVTIQMLT